MTSTLDLETLFIEVLKTSEIYLITSKVRLLKDYLLEIQNNVRCSLSIMY